MKAPHPFALVCIGMIAALSITMMLILDDISRKLSDIRTINSEARDALWCIQSPETNDCQP